MYYVFEVMVLRGQDITYEPRYRRREVLEKRVLGSLGESVRYSAPLDADLHVLIETVKAHGFEGLVAKRRSGIYKPGSANWRVAEDAAVSRSGAGLYTWRR